MLQRSFFSQQFIGYSESIINSMRILIAPLDWGLGHTTRIVPLVKSKLAEGNEVVLACSPDQRILLTEHFPDLQVMFNLPSYSPVYNDHLPMPINLLLQLRKMLRTIRAEHDWLCELLKKEKMDHIISDHRFGFYHPSVRSSILAHQLNIQGPWLIRDVVNKIQARYFNRFADCLIPDDAERSLSGVLSSTHYLRIPFSHIGALSRFSHSIERPKIPKYQWCVLISGPDPKRRNFLDRVIKIFERLDISVIIIAGLPSSSSRCVFGRVTVVSHMSDAEMELTIASSQYLLCRSGYSTIMDLAVWQRRALLVPTAGQTEQEYLAQWHSRDSFHLTCTEENLNASEIQRAAQIFS